MRDFHRPIKGHAPDGSRYAALDPETYFWAHATFFEAQIATQELFGTPLSDTAKVRLYEESITWYERYGVSMRPVPSDYAAFEEYWSADARPCPRADLYCARFDPQAQAPAPAPLLWMKGPWAVLFPLLVDGSTWLVRGTLPPRVREVLEVDGPRGRVATHTLALLVRGDGMWRPRVCAGCHELTMPSCEYRGEDEDAPDGTSSTV